MSIAPKPVIAVSLLLGVTAVWVPRLTGYDPFGWLPEELPTSSGIPSSGVDPHSLDVDSGDSEAGSGHEPGAPGPAGDSAADRAIEGIPLQSLQEVVSFLERRDGETRPMATSQEPVAEPAYVAEVELLGEPSGSPEVSGPTFAQRVQVFLEDNPLHTIIEGDGLTTATFGYLRVAPGDALIDETVRVTSIDLRGVELETPDGPVRVHLPLPGERTYSRRPAAPSATDSDATDLSGD